MGEDLGPQMHPDLPNAHRIVGLPSAASWGPGRLDFVATGDDGLVYHRYYDQGINPGSGYGPPGGWEDFPALPNGHRVAGPLRIVSFGTACLRFFVTGYDGVEHHRSWLIRGYEPEGGWKDYPVGSTFDVESGYVNPFIPPPKPEPETNSRK
jgi:hypothetical protein